MHFINVQLFNKAPNNISKYKYFKNYITILIGNASPLKKRLRSKKVRLV